MMLTDENGNVNEEYSYGPYGELLSGDASKTAYLYNGQYGVATDANGLYYMRTRYYNVSIKRFINQDVVTGTIDNSKSLNKFAYVQGNPIKLTDPFGLCPETNEAPSKFAFLHTALDIVGVFWDGADLINAGLYLAEGDYENAVISAVSAIPLVGSAVGTGVKLVTKCEKAADLIKVGSKIVGKAGNLTLGGETVVNSAKTIATNYSKNKKLFTKENLLCAANAALGVVAGVAAAKGIKSDVKAFKKIAGAEKAAESVTKTSQRVAADAESQLEKTAERTETTNPCTCKGNSQCFVAGTIIKTKDGEKNIEDVEVGDYVLARNPETREQEYKKVSETFAHKEDVIIHVQIGNEDIQTTFNHPFYVVGKGFVRAGKLEVGDEILTSEGQKISIEKIEIEVLAEPVYVYNFTVEDFHTYFVSELGVWVHNTCLVSKGGRASDLPVVEKGTKAWEEAVSNISKGGNTSYRTKTATDAKQLLYEARGNMNRYKRYTYKKYKKGYEMHPNEKNTINAPHNDLTHVKWKDWIDEVNPGKGHIFFDKPN